MSQFMKNPRTLLFVGFLFYTSKVCLYGAGFELPAGTPGLQAAQPDARLVYIIVPGTNIELCFPTDGSQPTTERAGLWSSARYVGRPNDNLATDWWVRIFGGTQAVIHSRNGGDPYADLPMGFDANNNPAHIISVNTNGQGTPQNFEQQFWQDFRTIAADPVGRVLLYRLLIEIRRVDNAGHGCCGDDVVLPNGRYRINDRNNCRSIEIYFDPRGGAFNKIRHTINFIHDNTRQTATLTVMQQGLTTASEPVISDIVLFHEVLHWFHWLRNPFKQDDNRGNDPMNFRYAMRCYYGNPSDLCAWGNIDAEEIATILGSPNLNRSPHPYTFHRRDLINWNAFLFLTPNVVPNNSDIVIQINNKNQCIPGQYKFLNGDDLSENTYRASRGQHMRFGHISRPIVPVSWPNLPDRFRLAHKVAYDCYQEITGNPPPNWDLAQGQAIR